jgi:plasmid stabilization system protein ParE
MARIVIAPTASDDLDQLISTLNLPRTTRSRVKAQLRHLADFPRRGPELAGRWEGFRFVLGPWPWMLLVYAFDEDADQVSVVTVQDARSARSATSGRRTWDLPRDPL